MDFVDAIKKARLSLAYRRFQRWPQRWTVHFFSWTEATNPEDASPNMLTFFSRIRNHETREYH